MIETNIAIVLALILVVIALMDRYSTETLLNYQKRWHEDADYRERIEEFKLKKDPSNTEKNLWIRGLVKRYGIHRGLTYASLIACVVYGYIIGTIIDSVTTGLWTMSQLVVCVMMFFFMFGFIFKQFLEAIVQKRIDKKIRDEEKRYI